MHFHKVALSGGTNPSALCSFPDGTNPDGSELHCYTPKQFLAAYGIDQVHLAGLTGKGQTIILADSYGSPTAQADLDHFSDTFGLPRTTIEFIYPNGAFVNPLKTADQVGWAQETTLDLEWAHAVAPGAKIVNIVANSDETTGLNGFPDLFGGIETAIKEYPGAIISMSLGTGEPTFKAADVKTYVQGKFHEILKKAARAGLTVLASSGDSGSTDINADESSLFAFPDAGYPASDPLITSVGGTSLQAGWTWSPEGTADDFWNCKLNHTANCPTDFMHSTEGTTDVLETVWKEDWAIAAGGGGVSTVFKLPSYQKHLPDSVRKLMNGHRGVPDVSFNAAINGGVDVWTSFVAAEQGVPKAAWQAYGGTSCASPELAGVIALAGEQASRIAGKHVSIGYLNPLLYQLRSYDFRDVVDHKLGAGSQVDIGDNSLFFSASVLKALGPAKVPPVVVPGFQTTEGYDLATGLGSPQAVPFVFDLAWARANREWFDLIELP